MTKKKVQKKNKIIVEVNDIELNICTSCKMLDVKNKRCILLSLPLIEAVGKYMDGYKYLYFKRLEQCKKRVILDYMKIK